jgi:hypothetical protein
MGTIAYRYDRENRLIGKGNIRYSYDRDGNLLTEVGAVRIGKYEYNGMNRMNADDYSGGWSMRTTGGS